MYSIKDLTKISGLTDRTLRNYLKLGVLIGEKKDGQWYFNEEQIASFLECSYVKSAIQSKRNAILFDYLKANHKDENTACIVLHFPKEKSQEVTSFFCEAVNKHHGLQMTFDQNKGENKVILVGNEEVVYDVLAEYHAKNAQLHSK